MATFLGRTPQTPRHIPTSNLSSDNMNDVVAVLSDPFFFISDAQHELCKRHLRVSGPRDVLVQTLFEALESEHASGWTLGYLLNTKILPRKLEGRDPRRLIGHHVEGYRCDEDGIITLELSDGENVTILFSQQSSITARIKMDDDLFWALHTLDGLRAVPKNLKKNPLLITEAATGLRKNRWGKVAGMVFGLRLEGMRGISFFFLASEASIREDRVCGNVWLADDDVLGDDIGMLHGGDEVVIEEWSERLVMEDETLGLEEDIRGLHGH